MVKLMMKIMKLGLLMVVLLWGPLIEMMPGMLVEMLVVVILGTLSGIMLLVIL